MKKTFKYFMLALLIIPCALVFTACGAKNLSNPDLARYTFDSYKQMIKNETYETWQDVKMTEHAEISSVAATEIPGVKQNAADTDTTTITKDFVTKYVADLTVERKGTKDDTVVVIKLTLEQTNNTYAAKTDLTLQAVETKTTQTLTQYYGRVGDKTTGKYYAAQISETTVEQKVDGQVNKDYTEGAVPKTTIYQEIENAEEFEEVLTRSENGAVNILQESLELPYEYLSGISSTEAEGTKITKTQSGKKVTVKASMEGLFVDGGLMNNSYSVKFNNYKLTDAEQTASVETFNPETFNTVNVAIKDKVNYEYASNATMLTQQEIETYSAGNVNGNIVSQLLNMVKYAAGM